MEVVSPVVIVLGNSIGPLKGWKTMKRNYYNNAAEVIDNGNALKKFEEFKRMSNDLAKNN